MTREEQRKWSDAKKQLKQAEKIRAKEHGFQRSYGFVFKFVSDFAYWVNAYILGDVKDIIVRIHVKYTPLDMVFWDVFEIPENRKQPKSFHISGTFVSPFIGLGNEFHIPIESSIDDTYCRALKKAAALIEGYSYNLNTAFDFKRLIENDEYQRLNLILLEIHEGNYRAALDILEQERRVGRSGGFAALGGGNIYDYAERYCKDKLNSR